MNKKAQFPKEALLDYRRDLKIIHEMVQSRHHDKLARVIKAWLSELSVPMTDEDLSRHAQKAIRALGGMESIGEIAVGSGDKAFIDAVESLYNSAKRLTA